MQHDSHILAWARTQPISIRMALIMRCLVARRNGRS